MKAITTKYHGPTNTRGARIIASDSDHNRVTVSYGHAAKDPYTVAAIALCRKMGWSGQLCWGSICPGTKVFVWHDEVEIIEVSK